MERAVAARLAFKTVAETKVALAVAVARNAGYDSIDESLRVTAGGGDVPLTELSDHHGGRFHYLGGQLLSLGAAVATPPFGGQVARPNII